MINDIYETTNNNLKNLISKVHIKNSDNFLVCYSNEMLQNCNIIKKFLNTFVYNHKNLIEKRKFSLKVVVKLFKYFQKNNKKLPVDWKNKNIDFERLICDYISGMSDRFALKLYKNIYE